MARSSDKTVLFATGKAGNSPRQWPVAVFNDPGAAKTYAAILKLSYQVGNLDTVKRLDPSVKLTDDGKLLSGVKFAVVTMPYAPSPDLEDEDEDKTAA